MSFTVPHFMVIFSMFCPTEGDHIKVTASKYPFPTVCANNQSTDWFQAISRTLKWNERERQKSFVVVEEEEPTNHDKRRKRAPAEEGGPEKVVHDQRNENPNEDVEDELSGEEDQFDIDDSSVETTDAAVTHALDMLTPQEHANAADKVRESRQQKHVMTSIKEEHGRPSNSRSRSRTAGNRQPSYQSHNSRHVDFDLSAQNDADRDSLHAAHQTSRDDISSARSPSARSYMPNRDSEEIARTPTATTLLHSRVRDHSRSRSRDLVSTRTFAVWGNDESDTSDSDAF
jgi:NAD+ kinase